MSEYNSDDLPVSILMLNDDCLIQIMDQLSMLDCKSFGLTCSRIFGVYQQNPQIVFKRVDVYELINRPFHDWVSFFKCYGNYIKELNIGPCNKENDCLLELKHLSQLKKLNLSNTRALTGFHMSSLPVTIESMVLNNCCALRMELLPAICKALSQLKELDIGGTPIRGTLIQQLVSGNCCDSLQNLSVEVESKDQNNAAIAMLPSLKKLTVMDYNGRRQLHPQLLRMLVEHKSKQLEYLCINAFIDLSTGMLEISQLSGLRTLFSLGHGQFGNPEIETLYKLKLLEYIYIYDCDGVSNDSLVGLILACPKLQSFTSEKCRKITNELLSHLIRELRLQKRSLPINLTLGRSKITDSMLQNSEVASKQIIHVKTY